jgi:two-component system, cell cycle sensor histidine kinase and response regulator CckA
VRRKSPGKVEKGTREALDLARAETAGIQLLLSDVILPQRSGSTLASEILPTHVGMRVVYMSGYTDDAMLHHGISNHGVPFLQKPFTPEALARKVRDVLD